MIRSRSSSLIPIIPAPAEHDQTVSSVEPGWELYLIYGVDDERVCTCSQRERCESPGKHPGTEHGIYDASSDPERIAQMFADRPRANVGLRTGRSSGVVVVDVDPRNGGFASLDTLEAGHGKLPTTRLHHTGGGGVHYLFAYPEHAELKSKDLAPGVELKAGTGIVLPPSNHESGGTYRAMNAAPLAPLPQWLLGLALKPELKVLEGDGQDRNAQPMQSRFELPERIHEGVRNDTIYRYGSSLRAHGWDHAAILDELRRANRDRCSPPLHDEEVRKIAGSAAVHEPGNASTASPKVLDAVGFLEEKARVRTAKGLGGRSRWSCYRALLDCAKRHGWMHQGRDVAVRISVRQLALDAGLSLRTLYRSLDALIGSGLLYRTSRGEGGTPGVLALRVPARQARGDTIRTTPSASPTGVSSCPSGPLYRLRHGAGRLGKTAAAVQEAVVECGEAGASRAEIAARLGRKAESLRAPLKKLVDRGLLERRVRGHYWLAEDWERALDRERTLTGEKQTEENDRRRYEREREAYRQHLAEEEV